MGFVQNYISCIFKSQNMKKNDLNKIRLKYKKMNTLPLDKCDIPSVIEKCSIDMTGEILKYCDKSRVIEICKSLETSHREKIYETLVKQNFNDNIDDTVLSPTISLCPGHTWEYVYTEGVLCRTETSVYKNLKNKLRGVEPIEPQLITLEVDFVNTVMIIEYKYDVISNDESEEYMYQFIEDVKYDDDYTEENIDYYKNGYIILGPREYELLDKIVDTIYSESKTEDEINFVFPKKYVNSELDQIFKKLKVNEEKIVSPVKKLLVSPKVKKNLIFVKQN